MAKNSNLTRAKNAKNDEFFTQLSDVEVELKYYRSHFKNKVVYCNCDDPTRSSFWRYFYRSFDHLGLKRLISTHYNMDGSSSYALIYEGGHDSDNDTFDVGVTRVDLKGNGDFRSDECVEYLKQSDIVVTNEPWSLTREYIKQLFDYHKQFLIIVNKNAITYKEVFPLLMNREMWIGATKPQVFDTPSGATKKVAGLARWFTNMSLNKTTDQVTIWKHFDQADYPAYDNYAAFEVSKVADIPLDKEITAKIDADNLVGWQNTYGDDLTVLGQDGDKLEVKIERPVWGTPITVLDKYNPKSQLTKNNLAKDFDILGLTGGLTWNEINSVEDFKRYEDCQQISKSGKVTNGSKMNTRAGVIVDNPKGTYYTADGLNGKLELKYARVLIRRKK